MLCEWSYNNPVERIKVKTNYIFLTFVRNKVIRKIELGTDRLVDPIHGIATGVEEKVINAHVGNKFVYSRFLKQIKDK